jgi:hypothetical protein
MWISETGRRLRASYWRAVEWRRSPADLSGLRSDFGLAEVSGSRGKAVKGWGSYRARRCVGCEAVWHAGDEFAICERCGDKAPEVDINRSTGPTESAPSFTQSFNYRRHLRAERADEAEKEQRERAVRMEPVISAATAALDYDLDRWLTDESAAWAAEEEASL